MKVAMVAADLTKRVAFGVVKVNEVHGWNNQATDLYIQFFEKPQVANGDIPVFKSLWVAGNGAPFSWAFVDCELSELLIAISTTEASYTAVGAGGGLDLSCVFQSDFPVGSDILISGNLTSAVHELQVWTNAQGPRRLMRLDIANNDASDVYAHIHALDTPSVSDSVARGPFLVTAGTTKSFFFGKAGLVPFEKKQDGTEHDGCFVKLSSGATLPYTFKSNDDYAIRALYATSFIQ